MMGKVEDRIWQDDDLDASIPHQGDEATEELIMTAFAHETRSLN